MRGYNRLTTLDPTFAPACLGILLASSSKPRAALFYSEQVAPLCLIQARQTITQVQQMLGEAPQV